MKKFKVPLNFSDDDSGHYSPTVSSVKTYQKELILNILIIDLTKKFIFETFGDTLVYELKKFLLRRVEKILIDPHNYGFYIPPSEEKLGKFLDESRLLSEYFHPASEVYIEFIKKTRLNFFFSSSFLYYKQDKKVNKSFIKAIKSQKINQIEKFLQLGLDPNFIDEKSGNSPLHLALTLKDRKKIMSMLLVYGAHKDFKNREGFSPLHYACKTGNLEAVREILDFGQSPNTFDSNGLTPVFQCIFNRTQESVQILKLLLYNHVLLSIFSMEGMTEIHYASKYNDLQAIDVLLTYGADVNTKCIGSNFINPIISRLCNGNDTPLHIAVSSNNLDVVIKLMTRGADPGIQNENSETPLDMACRLGLTKIIHHLKNLPSTLSDQLLLPEPEYNPNRRVLEANPYSMIREIITSNQVNFSHDNQSHINSSPSRRSNSLFNESLTNGSRTTQPGSTIKLVNFSQRDLPQSLFQRIQYKDVNIDRTEDKFTNYNSLYELAEGPPDIYARDSLFSMWKLDERNFNKQPTTHTLDIYGYRLENCLEEVTFGFTLKTIFKAELGQTFSPSFRYPSFLQIQDVIIGSQAEESGLRPNDYVISINNIKLVKCTNINVLNLFKNTRNLKLSLVVVRQSLSLPRSASVYSRNLFKLDSFGRPHDCYSKLNIDSDRISRKMPFVKPFEMESKPLEFDNNHEALRNVLTKSISTNSFHASPPMTNHSFCIAEDNTRYPIMMQKSQR